MSAEVSKTRVGLFVVGALSLLVAGIVYLGGQNLFSRDIGYVLYFDGSVSGLNVGAPVVFRGVPLGNVTKISLVANAKDDAVTIPVYIRIDEGAIVRPPGTAEHLTEETREEIISRMVKRGLRARLALQSFITGQYRVELDFFPETPARYHSVEHMDELPTVPSQLDQFQRALAKLPLESIVASLQKTLEGLSNLASNQNLADSLVALKGTMESIQRLVNTIEPVKGDLPETMQSIREAAEMLPVILKSFQQAMGGIFSASGQLSVTLDSTNALVARDSRTVRDVQQALKEFSEAARAIRSLANLLERHPEALLLGKGEHR